VKELVDSLTETGLGGNEKKWASPQVSTRTAQEIVDELRQSISMFQGQAPEGHVNLALHLVNELSQSLVRDKRNLAGASGNRLPEF